MHFSTYFSGRENQQTIIDFILFRNEMACKTIDNLLLCAVGADVGLD
jgi:hypothetical protein